MIPLQDIQVETVINPTAIVDNTSWTTNEIDTQGFAYATFIFHMGANDIALSALKVQESDTSGSGMADITGADFSVSPATLPSATDDNKVFIVHLDLTKRKRYLDPVATNGNGTVGGYMSAICILSRSQAGVTSDTAGDADQVLRV